MPLPPKIVEVQKRYEEQVIQLIRMHDGRYDPLMPSTPLFNAIKRLEAAGRIRWEPSRPGRRCGYVEVQ